jgi:hypothetical protein
MKRKKKKNDKYLETRKLAGAEFGMIRSVWHKTDCDYNRGREKLKLKKEYGI